MIPRRKTRQVPVAPATMWQAFLLLIIGFNVFFCGACQSAGPGSVNNSSPSPTEHDWPLRLAYSTRIAPEPLTPEQQTRIIDTCKAMFPQKPVWFVYVRSNRDGNYLANIYFEPARCNGRVFRGQSARLCHNPMLQNAIDCLDGRATPASIQNSTEEYVYVSPRKDGSFASGPPSGNELPFELTANIADERLVEIVDFYREGGASSLPGESLSVHFNKSKPILSFGQDEKGLKLTTGWSEGFLSGSGETIWLQRSTGVWRVIRHAQWVS